MEAMSRLLWKEMRTQAPLWLAMLAGVFLLSLSVTLSSTPTAPLSDPLIGIVYVLTAGFAAASAAVLFAGESEEGHANWLRQLPMNTAELITGKVGFGVLATGLLLVASYLVAAIVARWNGYWLKPQFVPVGSSLLCIAGCFAWGVLYSALMSRVLAVIVAAAFTTLALQTVLNALIRDVVVCDVVHACVLLVVALVNRGLLWRWHRNELSRQPVVSVSPAIGHSLGSIPLKWLVTTGPLEVRRWTVLFWKECCAALPAVIGAVLLLACANAATDGYGQMILLPAVTVLFGLRTFRSEHRENVISFLTDRGVPGTRVWLIKVTVWLSAAALTVMSFLIWEQMSIGFGFVRRSQFTFSRLIGEHAPYHFRLDRSLLEPSLQIARARDLVSTFWSLGGGLLVGLFAIGQMASFWIRRTILSFAAAFVGGVMFILWALAMTENDIPLSVSVWPAALLFLVSTWDTRRFWMEQKTGWPVRRRQLIWILFPVVLCPALALVSRSWQVPEQNPGFDWRQYSNSLDALDREWTNRWEAASSQPKDGGPSLSRLVDEATPERRVDPLLMASITGTERAVSVRNLIDNFGVRFPTLPTDTNAADILQESLKQQWYRYRTSLKGVRYLAAQTSSWADFEICVNAERSLLSRIRAWSAHEHQTEEMLDEALRWLSEDTVASEGSTLLQSFREMVKRRYIVLRGLFTGEGRIGTAIDNQLHSRGRTPHWVVQSFVGAPERERLLNLLAWATNVELRMPLASLPGLQKGENRPGIWTSRGFDYQRYASTTFLLPPELHGGAAIETSETQIGSNQQFAMLNVLQSRAITVVAIELQRHRLKHGQFPESLAEMTDSPVPTPADPRWDRPFTYTRGDDSNESFKEFGRFIRGQPMLKGAEQPLPPARTPVVSPIDDWESRMEIQPLRVLVLPAGESLDAANEDWRHQPEPERPLFDASGGDMGFQGMQMGESMITPAPPKSKQLPMPPFDI
jgi:hypothetical protein